MKLQLREGAQRQDEIKQTGWEGSKANAELRSYLDVEAEESSISRLLVWKSQIGPESLLINLSDDGALKRSYIVAPTVVVCGCLANTSPLQFALY